MTAALAIFVEPAPYKTALIRELSRTWRGRLEVLFIGRELTQTWSESIDDLPAKVLPANALCALRHVTQRLRGSPFDVLHVAGWGHPILLGSMIYASMRGIPVVADTDTPAPASEPAWKRGVKAAIYPSVFRLPEIFLPAGSRQAAYLKKYRVGTDRIRCGQMTVDVEAIAAYASTFSAEQRTQVRQRLGIRQPCSTAFLFVGRLEDYKGIEDLLEAFLRLRTQRSDVALLIAGSGRFEGLARAAAASLRSVHYLGHLSGDSVWEAYCAADALILPSRSDSWGLVVNEAMAAGLPVVASDAVGCIDDLVKHGGTGFVFPSGQTSALCSAMSDLAANEKLRLAMGTAARQLISNWTLAKQVKIMIGAWESASK